MDINLINLLKNMNKNSFILVPKLGNYSRNKRDFAKFISLFIPKNTQQGWQFCPVNMLSCLHYTSFSI